jgi:hypothetical protein
VVSGVATVPWITDVPTITIDSPSTNSSFTAGSTVLLSGNAVAVRDWLAKQLRTA